tara:strand:+ start:1984 stop:3282 length:1299 start_codon:yes stop_codon:yes gene_type:complete
MDPTTIAATKTALSKEGIKLKSNEEVLFKSVDKIKGDIIVDSRGKYLFQLALDKETILPFGILTTKKQVKGHLGMTTRKDTTASSNVNEFLTVYFLKNKDREPKDLENDSCEKGDKSTGILTGEGTPVTFQNLCDLIDADETAERDINIGRNNAKAVKKDIDKKKIKNLYWVPRGKPQGISPKTPSDVILEFEDGTFQGYSNKISAGEDKTPKFNTNMYAFYGKLDEGGRQQTNIAKLIDNAWNKSANKVNGKNAKKSLEMFDIKEEKFSESSSKEAFARLSAKFKVDGLDFYTEGFYYLFRNTLIKDFAKYLTDAKNLVYFLNTIYFYTYDDPTKDFTPCPYKLLVGKEQGDSEIKDVSADEGLKNLLFNTKATKLSQIQSQYDQRGQSFSINFKFEGQMISVPITCRTRAAGGWSGKSLFITTSGLKFVT